MLGRVCCNKIAVESGWWLLTHHSAAHVVDELHHRTLEKHPETGLWRTPKLEQAG